MYQDSLSGDGTRSGALFVFGGVSLIILLALLAGALSQGPTTPQDVAAELGRAPGLAEPLATLRRHYPDEYRDMLDRLAAAARQRGRQAMEREGFYFMRGFMTAKADAMARAPEARLDRLADAYLALMETLGNLDARACAEAAVGGFALETRLPWGASRALGNVVTQQILVARTGEDAGRPPRDPPSPADLAAWRDRIAAIDRGSAVLIEQDVVALAPPDRQCRAGIVLFRALTELPAPTAATIMAHLLRDTPGARPRPPPRPTI